MAVGFQVINDFNSYQIDEYYQNLFLDNKYTIDKRRLIKNPNSNFYYHDLVFTSDTPPVVAVGVYDNINTACYGMKQANNQYTAKIATSSNTQNIDIYVFNTLNGSQSTYGLQVFDENGKLIFDALKKPLRLVGIQNQNSKSTPMLESGRKYAVCHNRHFTHKVFTHIDIMNVGRYGGWQPHLGIAGSFLDLEIVVEYICFFFIGRVITVWRMLMLNLIIIINWQGRMKKPNLCCDLKPKIPLAIWLGVFYCCNIFKSSSLPSIFINACIISLGFSRYTPL